MKEKTENKSFFGDEMIVEYFSVKSYSQLFIIEWSKWYDLKSILLRVAEVQILNRLLNWDYVWRVLLHLQDKINTILRI